MEWLTQVPAQDSDREFARDAHHAAYREFSEGTFGPWDPVQQDGMFARGWRPEVTKILVMAGSPCGYAVIEERSGWVELEELVVHPRYQRQGIGTAVVRAAMARAATLGVPLRLRVFKQNRARILYERLGFRECGSTPSQTVMEWAGPSPVET